MDNHNHSHVAPETMSRKFLISMVLLGVVLLAESLGGLWTNSLALLSDAGHVFMDLLALLLAWMAIKWAMRPATNTQTYGWQRAEIFAALINGISIAAIAIFIVMDAIQRMRHPEPVKSGPMMVIAIAGLIVNLVIALILMRSRDENINVRSAFLHVIGDALASVGVIAGGLVISTTGWYVVDPLISVFIALIIVVGGYRVVRESLRVLIEGAPANIDSEAVIRTIRDTQGVCGVHDFHLWSISSQAPALSAHVVVPPELWIEAPEILGKIERELKERFSVLHTTIQMEKLDGQPDQAFCDVESYQPKNNENTK